MATDPAPPPHHPLTPQEFIDAHPMSRRQWLIVVLGLLAMIADGLDATVVSFVYPRIRDDWSTPMSTVTALVTAGVLSMIVGGAAAGPLADRYGRKSVAVAGIAVFATATAGMSLAQNVTVFAVLRLTACLGLGAILPTVMALVADWTPAARRVQCVALAFSGVTGGIVLGGVLASLLVPAAGWQVLLAVSGLAPLLLVPALWRLVPETVGVLTARGAGIERIRAALATVAPHHDTSRVHPAPAPGPGHAGRRPAKVVLSRRLARTTLWLWVSFFLGQAIGAGLITYLPLLAERTGLSAAQAAVATAAFGWGGLVGQLSVSFVLKRHDRFRVLVTLWAASIAALVAASATTAHFAALIALMFTLGLCLPAANSALQAIAAVAYPASARATGVSWANTAGKLGPVASGLLGGLMVDAGWSLATVLLTLTVPVAVCVAAAVALATLGRRHAPATPAATTAPHPAPLLAADQP
ncbi:MFS transporter [Streptomyces sp. NPDC003717]|uniref:MFS transporter n=1 Tax=Streptomyces sp. NPDC003717 TaxID=3154276 RepID=UPI00339E8FD1